MMAMNGNSWDAESDTWKGELMMGRKRVSSRVRAGYDELEEYLRKNRFVTSQDAIDYYIAPALGGYSGDYDFDGIFDAAFEYVDGAYQPIEAIAEESLDGIDDTWLDIVMSNELVTTASRHANKRRFVSKQYLREHRGMKRRKSSFGIKASDGWNAIGLNDVAYEKVVADNKLDFNDTSYNDIVVDVIHINDGYAVVCCELSGLIFPIWLGDNGEWSQTISSDSASLFEDADAAMSAADSGMSSLIGLLEHLIDKYPNTGTALDGMTISASRKAKGALRKKVSRKGLRNASERRRASKKIAQGYDEDDDNRNFLGQLRDDLEDAGYDVKTFEEAGVLTNNLGLVIDGRQLELLGSF